MKENMEEVFLAFLKIVRGNREQVQVQVQVQVQAQTQAQIQIQIWKY